MTEKKSSVVTGTWRGLSWLRWLTVVTLVLVLLLMLFEESLIFFPSRYPEGDWGTARSTVRGRLVHGR